MAASNPGWSAGWLQLRPPGNVTLLGPEDMQAASEQPSCGTVLQSRAQQLQR